MDECLPCLCIFLQSESTLYDSIEWASEEEDFDENSRDEEENESERVESERVENESWMVSPMKEIMAEKYKTILGITSKQLKSFL
eukprot:10609379-Ditylum_brightwellii.AAC.1